MNDFFGAVSALTFLAFTAMGVALVLMDFRWYPRIYEECKEVGFIQDEHSRIYCNVEDENTKAKE